MKIITSAINQSKRITFTFHKYHEKERLFIESTLEKYLDKIGHKHITNTLSYCLHEQASNACKANTKRLYFEEKNLNIENEIEYKTGMKSFKDEIVKCNDYYTMKKKEMGLYIKFQIKIDQSNIFLSIINNVKINNEEQNRINHRIEKSKKYDTIIEAFDEILDSEEGAGLGICTMLIMLKEICLKQNSFKIFSNNDETHSTISVKYC